MLKKKYHDSSGKLHEMPIDPATDKPLKSAVAEKIAKRSKKS